MKSSRRTSFLSCLLLPSQPSTHRSTQNTTAHSIKQTYNKRFLLLTLPFIRVRKPIERDHLLCMSSIGLVDSLLIAASIDAEGLCPPSLSLFFILCV